MYGFYNWTVKVRKYYKFTNKELQFLGISILIMSIILGFDDGRETFSLIPWAGNFLLGAVAITLAVLVHESARRIVGLEQGFRIEFKPFFYGMLAGLVLAFMSYGNIILLAYSGMKMHTLKAHRLGYFRYQLGYFVQGKIAFFAILSNLGLAVLFKAMFFLPSTIRDMFVFVNVLFAITNALPIPPMDGANLMYASRTVYAITLGAVVAMGLLLLVPGVPWLVIVIATIATAFLSFLLLFRFLEKP